VYANGNVAEALKDGPPIDQEGTLKLAYRLFPKQKLEFIGVGDLSHTCPPDDEVHIGCFPGVSIVAAKEFGIDYPSNLPQPFLAAGEGEIVFLHAMHSVFDWFAYAHWINGSLVRSLSLSSDSGIVEDIGQRLPFEEPFWSGQHPAADNAEDDDPLPVHPLDLGEAALKEFFGYQLEGFIDPVLLEPESIPLLKYKRSSSRWKLW
jgi:hypothetical protein